MSLPWNLFVRLSRCIEERDALAARVAELERDLEQAKHDRNRAAMDARNPLMAQLAELEARCKRLEEAGDKMHWSFMHPFDTAHESVPDAWTKAKEAKP